MPITCDFCTHRRCPWRYRVVPFQFGDPPYPPPSDIEEWAACRRCHALIQAENYRGLAARTVDTIDNPAVILTDTMRQELEQAFLDRYEEFAARRVGPPLLCVTLPGGVDNLLEGDGIELDASPIERWDARRPTATG